MISNSEDLKKSDMETSTLMGIYREFDARMKQMGAPVYSGYAAVELEDGTLVNLYPLWHKDALREEDERRKYVGKKVLVSGVVFYEAPEDPKGGTSLLAPCIMEISSINEK